MITQSPSTLPPDAASGYLGPLRDLGPLDVRQLLGGIRRAGRPGHAPDAELRLALARDLRLQELVSGRRLTVNELSGHVVATALRLHASAVAHLADNRDDTASTGGWQRLTAREAATALTRQRVARCALIEQRGRLGTVSGLDLDVKTHAMRLLGAPLPGVGETCVDLRRLDVRGRDAGRLDPAALIGAVVTDAVPAAGRLADEASSLWLQLMMGDEVAHALVVGTIAGGQAPRSGTLVFECRQLDCVQPPDDSAVS